MEKVNTSIKHDPVILFHKEYGPFSKWPEMAEIYNIFYTREWQLNELIDDHIEKYGKVDENICLNLYEHIRKTTFGGKEFKTIKELAFQALLPETTAKELCQHAVYAAVDDYTSFKNKLITLQ